MASVVQLASNVILDDEFGDFDVREELERKLEQRLAEADVDTRPALRSFEPSADDDQLLLIRASGETIRLLAPAGSGKTQPIINRVLRLVKDGARPERILCLTFDNSAGRALRDKIEDQLSSLATPANKFQI